MKTDEELVDALEDANEALTLMPTGPLAARVHAVARSALLARMRGLREVVERHLQLGGEAVGLLQEVSRGNCDSVILGFDETGCDDETPDPCLRCRARAILSALEAS